MSVSSRFLMFLLLTNRNLIIRFKLRVWSDKRRISSNSSAGSFGPSMF